MSSSKPGSRGEHQLQEAYSSEKRAQSFYDGQMLDYLNHRMIQLIGKQEMMFVATADARGESDCSFRAGLPGFVVVLDERTLVYPEYRGNGVYASLGNITENSHVGLLFVDFFDTTIGLHVNGTASILESETLLQQEAIPGSIHEAMQVQGGRCPERWVQVHVEEAYIHCSKHVPRLGKLDKKIQWGTDDESCKGGDFFGTGTSRDANQE